MYYCTKQYLIMPMMNPLVIGEINQNSKYHIPACFYFQQKRPPLRVASSQSNSFARPTPTLPAPAVDPRNNNSNTLKTAATAATATTVAADLDRLKRLPGYGSGFLASNQISEAVAVLGPYLKIFGPHLGRDPIMFARVRLRHHWAMTGTLLPLHAINLF